MKTFNGGVWADGSLDTGKRDITSYLNFTVTPYYYRSAPRDDDKYQVEPGEVDLKCYIRRKDFKVTLTLDVISVSSEFAAKYGILIPAGVNSPIKKIGAPVGNVMSYEKLRYTSLSFPTAPGIEPADEFIMALGKGLGVATKDENALAWMGDIYMYPGRFTIQWVTSDPFPKTIVGVSG